MIDAMLALILSALRALRAGFRPRADLVIENLALRQQLAILQRNSKRPRLRHLDRAFWLLLSRIWSRFADVLVIVKPDTIVRWHRRGFRLYWRWKSRPCKPKKGEVTPEIKKLIRQMAEANDWGAPRIHGELLKLGIDIGERSVSRFMPPKSRKPPSHSQRHHVLVTYPVAIRRGVQAPRVPTPATVAIVDTLVIRRVAVVGDALAKIPVRHVAGHGRGRGAVAARSAISVNPTVAWNAAVPRSVHIR
jgi:hypothetical protein